MILVLILLQDIDASAPCGLQVVGNGGEVVVVVVMVMVVRWWWW